MVNTLGTSVGTPSVSLLSLSLSLFLSLSLASFTCFAVFGWNSGGEIIGHRVDGKVGHSSLYSAGNSKTFRSQITKVCRIWWNLKGGWSLEGYGTTLPSLVLKMENSFERISGKLPKWWMGGFCSNRFERVRWRTFDVGLNSGLCRLLLQIGFCLKCTRF